MLALRVMAVAAALGGLIPASAHAQDAGSVPAALPDPVLGNDPTLAGEKPITTPGVEGEYLKSAHARIHWRWAHGFVEGVFASKPPTDPVNNPALTAEVLFTIRWDGSAAEVTLSRSSGVKAFDAAVLTAVRGDIPYPVPPLALFGDDGVAHFRWTFARDARLCGDGEVRRRELPLEEALPRLFLQSRFKEALLRVNRAMEAGDVNAMGVFARSWLARPFTNRAADIAAASALARVGDRRQIDRLKPGLASPETVAVAARGLAALKVDLCTMLDPALHDPEKAPLAMTALREVGAGASAPPTGPCLATLGALVGDEAAPKPLRALALRTYALLDPTSARRHVILLLTDSSAELRAAAAEASGKPGGGRPALYRLEPLLKDASPEVRAAAAAAIVRACGDISFDYLNPLFKSNDDRPLLALTPALGEMSTSASADLLARILKRDHDALDEAVTRALAVRKDEKARAMFKPLAAEAKKGRHASNELRLFLYANAPLAEVMPLANDPHLGILAYRAMLRAKHHKEAADWLVSRFDRLSPEVLGEAFGDWLANPPDGRTIPAAASAP